jgi:hypothetical protein
MAEQKTTPTIADPARFIAAIDDPQKRADAAALIRLLAEVTGQPPVMWGPSIVGFGQYHYRYASGHAGDTFVLGFSPRKQNLTLYLPGVLEPHRALLDQLGKHSTGKGCLYLKRLSDADPKILRRLLEAAVSWLRTSNPSIVPESH